MQKTGKHKLFANVRDVSMGILKIWVYFNISLLVISVSKRKIT